jgi:cell wall-associated NlpC family hydrolase
MSRNRTRVGALAVSFALLAAVLSGCGKSSGDPRGQATSTAAGSARATRSAAPHAVAVSGPGAPSRAAGTVKEIADPQEASSFPAPASATHAPAKTPAKAGEAVVAAGAPSDAEVKQELQQMQAAERSAKRTQHNQLTAVPGGRSVSGSGSIAIPANVPEIVQRVIAGANEIADFPYVFGGGHASFVDNAYDCSGSVSYALAAGGLLAAPETSGELESWGAAGPGRYITVYANAGHTYMYVDGIMYNTAGRSGVYASRWQVGAADNSGFVVRHWPGL